MSETILPNPISQPEPPLAPNPILQPEAPILPDGEMQLDDARRVKVLSPGMLVFNRFRRNRLAVVGFVILLFMFAFSFLGQLFSPYSETEVFSGLSTMVLDYAGATYNTELRYTVAEGETFSGGDISSFLMANSKKATTFTSGESIYYIANEGENFYRIMQLDPVAEVIVGIFRPLGNETAVPEDLKAAYQAAEDAKQTSFTLNGVIYHITSKGKATQISTEHDVALAMMDVFDPYAVENKTVVDSYDFKLASGRAIASQAATFMLDGERYGISYGDGQVTIYDDNQQVFAEVSNIIVNPLDQTAFLPVDFKTKVRQTINDRQTAFEYTDANGQTVAYTIGRVNTTYNIKKETPTSLIRQFEAPSRDHLLGLDNNGMDVLTRLMYGGRVSLLVGFIVVIIEVVLGVIIGGISGYFGGWIDTILMRFVDLINSIPFYPMVIIFGSVMDTLEVAPMTRIFLLMIVLGLLGWTGVARVVRGQILSLREQDFMVATEATGIRTSRRIFRHLVPNVMPLLIVQATASLGGIIISEATLGFLGLGVKYPLASWGSIINVASDAYVMTNFWFMWIPAGMLILLTVLGFNFVGDGLRDAYDPKMKR